MPRILMGVSPIGLGHATRALVLSAELRGRGADVRIFSGGKAAEYMRGQGVPVDDVVGDPVPTVLRGEMRFVTLWYARSWLALRRTRGRTEKLVDAYSPDLVVCDEEFSGISVAERKGIKRVFISDELELGFARSWLSRKVEGRVERWYAKLQGSVDLLIIPEEGSDSGNRRYVGPIVRRPTAPCGEVRRRHSLPDGQMILFSMSGSGIGTELLRRVLAASDVVRASGGLLAVTGNRGPRVEGARVFDLGVVSDNQDLIACADLVVSTAGKSVIDEAASAGAPIVAIPIRYHAEQERNARALGYRYEDLHRLPELISEKLGRRAPGRRFTGEVAAADAILSLL
jgi:UDP-N-acetylglucosamine--N-acetylmuramyl-(pentapeptide) pyrophosphoryl-undecaprenol N-acetylglucosamine transferase